LELKILSANLVTIVAIIVQRLVLLSALHVINRQRIIELSFYL